MKPDENVEDNGSNICDKHSNNECSRDVAPVDNEE